MVYQYTYVEHEYEMPKPNRKIGKVWIDDGDIMKRVKRINSLVDLSHQYGLVTDEDIRKLKVGELYTIENKNSKEFKLNTNIYKMIGIVDKIYDVNVDSVVVKLVEGETSMIFSLTQDDCDTLGIEFEEGLQIFPKKLGWVRHIEKKEEQVLDTNDLSTYYKSPIDNTIRNIILELPNYNIYGNNVYHTTDGSVEHIDEFVKRINVACRENIPSIDMCSSFKENEQIPFAAIVVVGNVGAEIGKNKAEGSDKTLQIELDLTKKTLLENQTVDTIIGVSPKALKNKNLGIFKVTVDKKNEPKKKDEKKKVERKEKRKTTNYGWESGFNSDIDNYLSYNIDRVNKLIETSNAIIDERMEFYTKYLEKKIPKYLFDLK